jgi:predicted nucleic acid-binding protein
LTVYLDSSFLVSCYVHDAHSEEADRRVHGFGSLWITPLNRSEVAHAIHQCVFRGKLSAREAQQVWSQFAEDCLSEVWTPVEMPARAWETSIDLARHHGATLGTRTLDSLHVASALELNARRFWTFDERQGRLAQAVGLSLEG